MSAKHERRVRLPLCPQKRYHKNYYLCINYLPMLYTYQVYETLLDVARKDLRGRSLSPEEFNNVARLVNQNIFEKYYAEFESTLDNSEVLSGFKVLNEMIALVGGVGTLPARFFHCVGMPWYTDTNGIRRYIDLVSSMEHAKREQDYLTKATLTHPTCRLGIANTAAPMTIYVTPTTINPIYMDYIRTADTPILDYYLNDTTADYTWMATGVNVTVPAGSTSMNGTIGAAVVASSTANFEWAEEDLPLIINLFLNYLGIQLPSPEIFEGSTLLETKSDQR